MAYCVIADVIQLLPENISRRISDDNEQDKPVTTTDITNYMEYAYEMINSMISVLYIIPLRLTIEITYSDTTPTEVETYPRPVKLANAQLAASMIFDKLFSQDANPDNLPKYSEQFRNQAFKIINDIRSGAILLRGQVQTGWRYLRPESMNTDKLPLEFGKWETK